MNVGLWLGAASTLALAGRRRRARELAELLPDCVGLFRRLATDPRVPRRAKLVLVLLAAYLASPLDLIPDFVPVVGLADDAILAALAAAYLVRSAGRDVVEAHWSGSDAGLRVVLALA